MTLPHIALGAAIALLATSLFSGSKRGFFLFITSILATYALQPALPIRGLDFWLPTMTLGLIAACWVVVTPQEQLRSGQAFQAAAWMLAIVVLLGLTRYLPMDAILTASIPPRVEQVGLLLVGLAGLVIVLAWLPKPNWKAVAGILVLLLALVALKSPEAGLSVARLLRSINGQGLETASAFDVRWIGFSYIAFRLIHTLKDGLDGRLPGVSLREYVTYVIFFPALAAGPIDRLERFLKDLRTEFVLAQVDWDFVVGRLTLGLLKKFVLADSLALMALNPQNAGQVQSAPWAWVLLYAYALQIYFDFSGYTDLALALGRLAGIQLPENFNQPYLKPNLTQFWNNWHMSLTQWFRAYVFNPLTRSLRGTKASVWLIILMTQLVTMTLIGLWHGITLNFVLWGMWHGLGLFVHNRWQDAFRAPISAWASTPLRQQALSLFGWWLTFHYVSLGWVWFVLPTPGVALGFLARLFS